MIGNPGAGKSTLLNGLIGSIKFKAGFSCSRVTTVLQEEIMNGCRYIDTLGLSDFESRLQAAEEITKALKKGGYFRIFFVVTLDGGRVRPDDLITMRLVLEAAPEIGSNYSIILNKSSKRLQTEIKAGSQWHVKFNQGLPYGTNRIFVNLKDNDLEDQDDILANLSQEFILFVTNATKIVINF